MRWLLIVVAACSSPSPPAPTPRKLDQVQSPSELREPTQPANRFEADDAAVPIDAAPIDAAPSYQPTAFSVDVRGDGRPIILIPGLGCPADSWAGTVEHLVARHAQVHLLQVAGFSGAPPIDQPVVAAIPAELALYIRDRKLERPIVVGHSMGGFEAIWLAELYPELVGALVIVDAGATLGGGDPDIEPFAKKQRDRYRTMSAADFAETIRDRFSPMFKDPKKHDAILAAVTKSDQRAFAQAYWDLNTIDLRPKVRKLTMPTLLILADQPQAKYYREPMSELKQLEVATIANANHFVMLDQPDAFYRALDAFVAKL